MDSVKDVSDLGNILDIRFVDRQGRRILQVCYKANVIFGEVVREWEDVRMEPEE
jgi:hypothetical protein